ncbi:hypothetical protein ADUPG1_011024 [Aduncisulcus paluster]|uniref:Uncharacterized protein n=1 Tax=Aduncisulcus paluster TaxID=2918883 RepID=A0ABQ5JVZ4_9EUKA|nr:hypothetical protein ADUPG1_011024 [Aduncisulcus paluster]
MMCYCSDPKEKIFLGSNAYHFFTFISPEPAFIFVNSTDYPSIRKDDIRRLYSTRFGREQLDDQTDNISLGEEDFDGADMDDDQGYLCHVPSSEDDLAIIVPHDPSESMSEVSDEDLLTELHPPEIDDSSLDMEVRYTDIYHVIIEKNQPFVKLMIKKVLKREISESLYTEIQQSLKATVSEISSGIGIDFMPYLDHLYLPSLKSLKRQVKTLIEPISRDVKDNVIIPKQSQAAESCSHLMKYRWYTLYQYPIPRILCDYFYSLTHISPYVIYAVYNII